MSPADLLEPGELRDFVGVPLPIGPAGSVVRVAFLETLETLGTLNIGDTGELPGLVRLLRPTDALRFRGVR